MLFWILAAPFLAWWRDLCFYLTTHIALDHVRATIINNCGRCLICVSTIHTPVYPAARCWCWLCNKLAIREITPAARWREREREREGEAELSFLFSEIPQWAKSLLPPLFHSEGPFTYDVCQIIGPSPSFVNITLTQLICTPSAFGLPPTPLWCGLHK